MSNVSPSVRPCVGTIQEFDGKKMDPKMYIKQCKILRSWVFKEVVQCSGTVNCSAAMYCRGAVHCGAAVYCSGELQSTG